VDDYLAICMRLTIAATASQPCNTWKEVSGSSTAIEQYILRFVSGNVYNPQGVTDCSWRRSLADYDLEQFLRSTSPESSTLSLLAASIGYRCIDLLRYSVSCPTSGCLSLNEEKFGRGYSFSGEKKIRT